MSKAGAEPPVRVTIADVARAAGVSTATVSRVINGLGRVQDATAARVRSVIHDLNYVPHLAARGLAANRTYTLGLTLPEIGGHFFAELLRGIEEVAAANRYSLLIFSTRPLTPADAELALPLGEHNTDGLIVFTDSLSDAMLARLHARCFPLVLLHRSAPPGLGILSVRFENLASARAIVEHLIVAHGRRRIALLDGPAGNEDAVMRRLGYCAALAAHGIAFAPALVGPGLFDARQGEATVAQWMAAGLPIDAIFASDDEAAFGALTALRQAGKRVPEEVALVGFDDGILSRHMTPPLTTVFAPSAEAGRLAAEQLLCLINGEAARAETILPTKLVLRQSCGCPEK